MKQHEKEKVKIGEFKKWAFRMLDIDGGNQSAPLWICGIEPNIYPIPRLRKFYTSRDPMGRLVPCWNQEFRSQEPDLLDDHNNYDYRLSKVLLAYKNIQPINQHTVDEYRWNTLYDIDGDCFKLNLFPLDSVQPNQENWTESHALLIGIGERSEYETLCAGRRLNIMRKLIKKFSPKVILVTDLGHQDIFINAFGGFNPQDFPLGGGRNVRVMDTANGSTKLAITPFLGYQNNNLNADEHYIALGNELRRIVDQSLVF
jgi:hypothetical protein